MRWARGRATGRWLCGLSMLPLAVLAACAGAGMPADRMPASVAQNDGSDGGQMLTLEGRRYRVTTGSRDDRGGPGLSVLVLRDELSGQRRHFRSGLQFSLRPGVDAEAFIREHPRLQRLFVNPVLVQAGVEPAHIAALFEVLRADPRVERLTLLPIEAERKPRE